VAMAGDPMAIIAVRRVIAIECEKTEYESMDRRVIVGLPNFCALHLLRAGMVSVQSSYCELKAYAGHHAVPTAAAHDARSRYRLLPRAGSRFRRGPCARLFAVGLALAARRGVLIAAIA
jgi:hypothetical protein